MSAIAYYFDRPTNTLRTATGGKIFDNVEATYGQAPEWELHIGAFEGEVFTAADLSLGVVWEAAIAQDWDETTEPLVKTLNAGIDKSRLADGIVSFVLDFETAPLYTALAKLPSITGHFRLKGLNLAGKGATYVRYDLTINNDIDKGPSEPPDPPDGSITRAEVEALILAALVPMTAFLAETQVTVATGITYVLLAAKATHRGVTLCGVIEGAGLYASLRGPVVHNGTTAICGVRLVGDVLDDVTLDADLSGDNIRLIITNNGAAKKLVYGVNEKVLVST
jgi:hypothetical protein